MTASDEICHDVSIPVLIVGAGPAGATAALLLGRYGIPSIVISRHQSTANTPRAHIFNQRAMEVLRDAGIEGIVKPVASSKEQIAHVAWLHTLSGEEYGRVYAWGTKPDRMGEYLVASPCEMSDLPQSVLEPILVDEATKLGAEFRFSTEFIQQRQLPDGRVVTTVHDRATLATYDITSQYLVGADGARSSVLSSLGIPIDGKQVSDAFGVHIKADLSRYFSRRPGSMVWILNPDAPDWSSHGSIRMVRPWNEFLVSMHMAKPDVNYIPCAKDIIRRLQQMIGDSSVQIELLNFSRWTINDQVARAWQKGNVFCIGDAVHRHPPINGLGSNTCISDAFNIAWKLAYVLKGTADPSILETLTLERKPVGDGIVRRANDGMLIHRKLWALMGSTTEERAVVSGILQAPSIEGARLRKQLRTIIEETDDEFNALGIQMNQIYSKSPLLVVENGDSPPDLDGVNLMKQQVISTFPGFHLPHVWVVKDGQLERISTLDLAGHGEFVLFTGIGGEGWLQAARDIARTDGVPMKGYGIGRGLEYSDAYWDWEKVRGVEEDGAVLVRPDHFVCWRCQRLVSNPSARLREVIRALLRPG
ncbi:2,4-dichlorophenol 6-monooxygenase [Fonsecaea erecta]|uniref:2,4-dichlorophenol 6-monooxygenase n=1 Tax=Fonsecaea erecta TaxID=1367422 RepID=A0A178ZCU1_9EURO|nr:2,4-dichlorophenol 6-monooxygenase [Fonsecaea erecta]OAP57296.1 2,4-dichlorophenol 6-monooxygenase [Fonsecaea erecta]